jgi:PAS domain S-box-containing protein
MAGIAHITRDLWLERSADEVARLAVEACPTGMVMTDIGGTIVLANTAIERLFGYRRYELIGQKIELLLPERLPDKHAQRRAAFACRPEPFRFGDGGNRLGRRRDGTEFPVDIGLYPVRSGGGQLVLSVVIDASERRRTDRLKDEFVSTVSHELRTPLTSIAGSLGLLIGGAAGPLPEPAARLIRIAQSNSERLIRLITDILDIEKIDAGQVAFKFKRLCLRTLVEQVIEASRGYADGFRVQVRLDAAAPSSEVYADPDRLTQVITNLLSNATKFSPPGNEVAVSISEGNETVRLDVRDYGAGIPREFRPRIFERFAQADAGDARQKGGTGLGLSIVKQIVTRLGGTVGFEDAMGGGTIFYVVLPSWAQVAAREIDTEGGLRAARILLCEDNLDTAFSLRHGLRPLGFTTDFAHSPADAIARARATHYHAVIVDLDLPDGDGIGLIRTLRAQPDVYKTPIVGISADRNWDMDGPDTSYLNVLECIQKPVDIERLAQILDCSIVRDASGRPQILHVDDDQDVLEIVAETLDTTANVVSATSIEEARCALMAHTFDLAILDISIGAASGLDLLPDLRSRKDTPIPVIVFSAHGADLKSNAQVEASLNKSSAASLDNLLGAVRDRLMLRSAAARQEAV